MVILLLDFMEQPEVQATPPQQTQPVRLTTLLSAENTGGRFEPSRVGGHVRR